MVLIRLEKGGHYYVGCHENEDIRDLRNIGENTIKIAVVDEKVKIVRKAKK